uniref:C3H1-type domain-containing protein n=1 Tax=Gadus morhua TaxID=8049 RepID=A0A8C5ANU1_GADMO
MTNHGDDCYFYYYSTCTKGDSCPFRHCEAAMGNETVCNLWQEGRCFPHGLKTGKRLHVIGKNQPAGCQKTHCVFYHEKQRLIDGVVVPPSRGTIYFVFLIIMQTSSSAHTSPRASNPQLRGVLKAEAQETVPSPTHPPVVINPADDDEDEDGAFIDGPPAEVFMGPVKI